MRTILFVALLAYLPNTFADDRVRLLVKEVPLKVHGKEFPAVTIEQENGQHGLEPEKESGFHVEVVNQLKVPTAIHWHGLVLPNAMDGVPFVTQQPIPPGGTFQYDFPLKQSGTYWMHSHYGLQEQFYNSAPLIIWTPEERAKATRQFVVMLSDFSRTPPADILKQLQAGMPMPKMDMPAEPGAPMKMEMPMKMEAPMKKKDGLKEDLFVQQWDGKRLSRQVGQAFPAEIDVTYDALLANRRTIDDPEVLAVKPGETVLLRLIAASAATNFFVSTGELEAELLAVDGKSIKPVKGDYFQLAIAQRMDLRVRIPDGGGVFPIVAQGEGSKLICGIVLATEGASAPSLHPVAERATAALDNTQEKILQGSTPLAAETPARTLPCALGGDMAKYTWSINGNVYPNRDSLDVKQGERVEILFTNKTNMGHPMHLHGHDYQVVEIDGEKISGAMRDTVMIPPGSTIRIAFDADNPGIWAFHCHLLYHLATGMFTVVKYEDVNPDQWKPEESKGELSGLEPINSGEPR